MLSAKRHEIILEMLDRDSIVKVSDLSIELNVTEKTIRMDLMALEEKGLLKRVHGGAIPVGSSADLFPIAERQEKYISEKKKIALKAVESIKDGDTIFLDGGSTMMEIARLLDQRKVTVITNDLRIGTILAELNKPEFIMLGGMPIGSTTSLYGPLAKDALTNMHVKHLFLGTTGLSLEHGLTVFHTLHAEYKREIMKISERITLCCDSTKVCKMALFKFADIKDVNTIIIDKAPDQNFINHLIENDVELVIA